MKVHPETMELELTFRDGIGSAAGFRTPQSVISIMEGIAQKKLRRLPHVFSKVLELPFRSETDVAVDDRSDCFRFVARIDEIEIGGDVRACAVEVHPGVEKIVIRSGGRNAEELLLDQLKVDSWRFRLPASTRPELANASIVNGALIVTVPKTDGQIGSGRKVRGAMARLVLVE